MPWRPLRTCLASHACAGAANHQPDIPPFASRRFRANKGSAYEVQFTASGVSEQVKWYGFPKRGGTPRQKQRASQAAAWDELWGDYLESKGPYAPAVLQQYGVAERAEFTTARRAKPAAMIPAPQ